MEAPNGTITEVIESYENLGNTRNNGIEFGVNYISKEYDWGKVDFEFSASYLYNIKQQTPFGVLPSGALFYRVLNETDTFQYGPDFKLLTSLFYSKTLFRIDTFKTGLTLHFTGSELDVVNSSNNTNPTETLDAPNYVHLIGNWTTVDWQISYQFGQPTEVAPETPKAGYSKEGKWNAASLPPSQSLRRDRWRGPGGATRGASPRLRGRRGGHAQWRVALLPEAYGLLRQLLSDIADKHADRGQAHWPSGRTHALHGSD